MPLMPRRVLHRKFQRGRIKGKASRGNRVSFGEYGLQALERSWITGEQIEACRLAVLHPQQREAASAALADESVKLIFFLARRLRIRHEDALHRAAGLEHLGEHAKLRAGYCAAEIAYLAAEADVWLVGAETRHHFFIRVHREWALDLQPSRFLKYVRH